MTRKRSIRRPWPAGDLGICRACGVSQTFERGYFGVPLRFRSADVPRFIPYALYRAEGYISAALANKVTDLSEEDVELLWTAIMNMFENDHSAARGKMCMRKLFVFKHDNVLGVCPSHLLFDKIQVKECEDVNVIRSIKDYDITVDREMPEGVELIEKL